MNTVLRQYPVLQGYFDFQDFNQVQKACLPKIMRKDSNMIVSAPTSSGKTALFEMAILKYGHLPSPMCLYLAPIKSLCHQKYTEWSRKFSRKLSVSQITGDSLQSGIQGVLDCHIAVGTPEKIDYLSRQNLEYLKNIKLLLIDEIHMLNYEQRGATLEAIVSRIMSLNSTVRIIAVSATIPNISQVGEWLRCPKETICVFGEQCRPVRIKTVVNAYAHSGNPFTFEKILNYKLLDTIRSYSESKGTLIFCPTQKGTQQSCDQIISQIREREFIENDKQLLALVQAAKQVSNNALQTMIPQGVAFHNAGLSYQDRNIVEGLFLDLKVKVLCTTSTLSMGINLPARLVIIKSTQGYRGAAKGYQQYSRIEIEQMMGRAGRKPFDTEGTVVIMTQKTNFHRYNSKLQLQNLESQLFNHMLEHINAQISLGSIRSLQDVESYFFNSFCFIRMKKSPKTYGINGNVEQFIKDACLKALQRLSDLRIINLGDDRERRVAPRPLSNSISRSAVEVRSIAKLVEEAGKIETSRQYLMALCKCEQIGKYTSKLEQRKILKQLNERNRFALKEAISNAQKKAFVLVQAQLSKAHIQYWEMRRQASDIMLLLKRLNYCVKTMGYEYKQFWVYHWATRYAKYFNQRFWEGAEKQMMLQASNIDKHTKDKCITNIKTMKNLPEVIEMDNWLHREGQMKKSTNKLEVFQNGIQLKVTRDNRAGNVVLQITVDGVFGQKYKGATLCIGDHNNTLYDHIYLNDSKTEASFYFPKNNNQYKVAIVKDGIVGFDEFYRLKGDRLLKADIDQQDVKAGGHRRSADPIKNQPQLSFEKRKSSSFDNQKRQKHRQTETIRKSKAVDSDHPSFAESDFQQTVPVSQRIKKSSELILPVRHRRKMVQPSPSREESFPKKIQRLNETGFKDLKEDYKWKPGFQEILSSKKSKRGPAKELKLVESKKKNASLFLKEYRYNQEHRPKQLNPSAKPSILSGKSQPKQQKEDEKEDVFNYFYNLF